MKIRVFACILAVLLLAGCSRPGNDSTDTGEVSITPPTTVVPVELGDYFSDRDRDQSYDAATATVIALSGTTATVTGKGAAVSGSTVTVNGEGTFILRGELQGMVIVDAAKTDKVQLVLDGAAITSASSAAIYVRQADKVFLTLAEGSSNILANGGSFVAIDEYNIDGAIFARDDLTLGGSGSLTVTSPAGHGIVAKDELTVTGGSITVTAASHGLRANDCICLTDATLAVTAGKDGLKAEHDEDTAKGYIVIERGSITVTADGDGISAGSYLQIADGSFKLTTGGGHSTVTQQGNEWGWSFGGRGGRPGETTSTTEDDTSAKGIKAAGDFLIRGGSFTIDAADDALHSNANLTVSGGTFTLASGDDGIHADAATVITGGKINITDSYEGIEGLSITISGGEIDLVASDDGLNAAGGNDGSGFGGFFGGGGFGGGGRGERSEGGFDTGNMPQMPEGDFDPNNIPQMPEGDFDPNNIPQMPEGDFDPNNMPQMPEGGFNPGSMPGGDNFAAGGSSEMFISITGGRLTVNAGGDGLDSNGVLVVTGGETYVAGPTNSGNGPLDYDRSASITGGTFIAVGAAGMAQNFTSAENQGVIMANLSGSADSTITLTDGAGKTLFSWTSPKSYSSILISTPELRQGETYTLTAGTSTTTVTLDSLISGSSGFGGMGAPGGMGGGKPGGGKRP